MHPRNCTTPMNHAVLLGTKTKVLHWHTNNSVLWGVSATLTSMLYAPYLKRLSGPNNHYLASEQSHVFETIIS